MLLLVNIHEKQKKKYSIRKKAINLLKNSTSQQKKKDKAREAVKTIKKEKKKGKVKINLKRPGNKNLSMDDTHTELELLT